MVGPVGCAKRRRNKCAIPLNEFMSRRILGLVWLISLLSTWQSLAAGGIVTSQIYGGGGNVGGVYLNDFIELFNGKHDG